MTVLPVADAHLPNTNGPRGNPCLDLANLPSEAVHGLYVHVPFCVHKCHYCDFYSITRQSPQRMARFVDLILREAETWRATPAPLEVRTVFFGGGTPSLLPADQMRRLLEGLAQRFDLSGVREWTVEVNPATADADYLAMMRQCGVDRVSIGAQSFDRNELAALERHHDPDDVPRAVAMARDAGISRQSLDLIFAIPGQTIDSWRRSLEAALATGVEHLSCYGLTYEPNTPLAVRRRLGRIEAVPEEAELEQFHATRRLLAEAGRPAYEVSNFARPGQASLHNLGYWHGEGYVGLGPSAASHVGGVRWRNTPHLGQWERAVEASESPAIEVERLDADARARELAWLNLRLAGGIDLENFRQRVGVDPRQRFSDVLTSLSSAGVIELSPEAIYLAEAGWPVADAVAAEFLAAEAPVP